MPSIRLPRALRRSKAQFRAASPVFSHSPTVADRARHAAVYDRFLAQLTGFDLQVHRGYVTVTWHGTPAFDLESAQ